MGSLSHGISIWVYSHFYGKTLSRLLPLKWVALGTAVTVVIFKEILMQTLFYFTACKF